MSTIPKEERAAATAALNEVKGWLGNADFTAIAQQLGNCTAATVRAVAKSERWTLDIYTQLLTLGRAKKANFQSVVAQDAGTASNRGLTADRRTSTPRTPEIAPNEPTIPFPEKGIKPKKARTKGQRLETTLQEA